MNSEQTTLQLTVAMFVLILDIVAFLKNICCADRLLQSKICASLVVLFLRGPLGSDPFKQAFTMRCRICIH